MKAKTIINIALGLVFVTCLFYWREVWGWVSAKTWGELAGDIIGFCLKWFYLAIFGWLAVQAPHYVTPWLMLARLNGRRRLRYARRRGGSGQQVEARATMPRTNKDQALAWVVSQMAKASPSRPTPRPIQMYGEVTKEDIQIRF